MACPYASSGKNAPGLQPTCGKSVQCGWLSRLFPCASSNPSQTRGPLWVLMLQRLRWKGGGEERHHSWGQLNEHTGRLLQDSFVRRSCSAAASPLHSSTFMKGCCFVDVLHDQIPGNPCQISEARTASEEYQQVFIAPVWCSPEARRSTTTRARSGIASFLQDCSMPGSMER